MIWQPYCIRPHPIREAFRLAVAQRADMIETDLHLTRDHAIALHHDPVVEGVEIGGLTLEDLRERAPTVPTLEDALDQLPDALRTVTGGGTYLCPARG